MKYRPEIDGLRALAVLAVIFYHAQLGCPGGYVGVDVFFVISGYLICQKLSQDIAAGTFRYRDFWARRVRRLLPSLALMLGVVVGLSWFVLLPGDFQELGLTLAGQPLLIANVVFWRLVYKSYFGIDPETRPTMHTWSLAVEEQFYLLCPLLLMSLARLGSRRRAAVLAGIALISWLLSGFATAAKPAFCYFLLPTRAFEILLGGLVGSWAPRRGGAVLSGLGLAALAVSVGLFSDDSVFPGWIALLPCAGTALLLAAARAGTASARWLTFPPLVWVGKISYSVYLWHWPLIAFWRYLFLPWGILERLFLVALSLLAGHLSTVLLENPIRFRRRLASDRALFRAAVVFALLCLACGSGLWLAGGFPRRFSASALKFLDFERGYRTNLSLEDLRQHRFVRFGASAAGARRLFVWGDSHAMALLGGLEEACAQAGVAGEAATQFSRPPFLCVATRNERLDPLEEKERTEVVKAYLRRNHPAGVILAARWNNYPAFQYQSGLAATLQFLQEEGIPGWIVLEVPEQAGSMPRQLARQSQFGRDLNLCGVPLSQYREETREFVAVLDQLHFPASRRLDPSLWLVNSAGICRAESQGVSLYVDESHLCLAGSRFLKPMYEPLLR